METIQTVQKWGNGTGIRLPKQVLQIGGLGIGQRVSLEVIDGAIVLTPIKERPALSLHSLLKGVSPDQVGGEIDWGTDQGHERYE